MSYPKNRKPNSKFLLSENQINDIINLYLSGKTIRQICKIYKSTISRISKILKENKIPVLKAGKRRRAELKIDKIILDYQNEMPMSVIMKKYKVSHPVLREILITNKIELKSASFYAIKKAKFSPEIEEQIIIDYIVKKLPIDDIAKNHNCDFSKIRKILVNNKIPIISDYKRQMAKLTKREEDEAIQLYLSGSTLKEVCLKFDTNFVILKRILLENGIESRTHLQIFSKRFGYIGTYKGLIFRSLMELTFILDNEKDHLIESAEYLKIPYFHKNKNRKYYPDFLIDKKEIVEIKPNSYIKQEITILKCAAAKLFCDKNNLTFRITEWETSKDKIKPLILNGEVRILNKDKESIDKYFSIDSPIHENH